MTPSPHPRLVEKVKEAMYKAVENNLESASYAASMTGLPLCAVQRIIDYIKDKEVEVVDPQYIP